MSMPRDPMKLSLGEARVLRKTVAGIPVIAQTISETAKAACGAFVAVLRNHAEVVLAHADRESPKAPARSFPVRSHSLGRCRHGGPPSLGGWCTQDRSQGVNGPTGARGAGLASAAAARDSHAAPATHPPHGGGDRAVWAAEGPGSSSEWRTSADIGGPRSVAGASSSQDELRALLRLQREQAPRRRSSSPRKGEHPLPRLRLRMVE